jgi:hypothetical protein
MIWPSDSLQNRHIIKLTNDYYYIVTIIYSVFPKYNFALSSYIIKKQPHIILNYLKCKK